MNYILKVKVLKFLYPFKAMIFKVVFNDIESEFLSERKSLC